jgi:IclR family transcriptional regulator, acetate operon repressor
MKHSPATETLALPLDLLEWLTSARQPVGVSDLARTFKASKATVYRHLQALAQHGFVTQDAGTQRYQAGIKLFVLGERLRERFDILNVGRKEMAALRDDTGQTAVLSVLEDRKAVVLELVRGQTIVELGTRPGTVLELHASAQGKVALAFGPPDLLAACLSKSLKACTPNTIRSRPAIERAIAQVRAQGWAAAPDEFALGINAVAAPVLDHRGAYAGAIAIVGLTQYIPAHPPRSQIAAVTSAANRISRQLGWRPR